MENNRNIIITGITSIHGWPIFSLFRERLGEKVFGVCPPKMSEYFTGDERIYSCNIEDTSGMKSVFDEVMPSAVIHAGGVCDLDMCEDSPDFAYKVNVIGTRNIIDLAKGSYVLYISSDLVFSGNNTLSSGYIENCNSDSVSVVGRTYAEAEKEVLKHDSSGIIRLGLPIGPSISGTKGAVDFIAKRLSSLRKMTLFHDEIRSLITTEDVARGVFEFFKKRGKGVFHFGGSEEYSLYDIGAYIVKKFDLSAKYLIKASRSDQKNGPPRIGRVTLDSSKFYDFTRFIAAPALEL